MALFSLGSRSRQPNRLGSIQVSTSEYGVTVPYGAGTFKAPIKLLDFVDFKARKVTAGGKGGGGNYNYEYYAAIEAMICKGPAAGAGNFYDGGGASQLLLATETYTISGACTYRVLYWGDAFYYDQGVTTPRAFAYTANDYGSDGATTVSGVRPTPLQKITYSVTPAAGQYSVETAGANPGLYTFAAADIGKTVTLNYSFTTADVSSASARAPIERYALGFNGGFRPGVPWGYMQTYYPERALHYPGLVRVNSPALNLGSSATVPSVSVEVLNARGLAFGGGIADCDPAAILADILVDAIDGCNWPHLADLTQFSNFCVANNLFMSPFLDSQRKATDVVKEIVRLANAEAVWSGAQLKVIPYGDTTIANNGRTFTPTTEPIYELDLSDLVCKAGEEPIKSSWQALADNYNRVELEYTRRDDSYNTATLRAQDEASISMLGVLPLQTIAAHHFCERDYAAVAMDMLLKRNSVALRQHEFALKWWYLLLEPMDIITFAPGLIDAGTTPVRIVSIEEQEDYTLKVVAEDFRWGVGSGVLYPKGDGFGTGPGAHDLPGHTQVLAAFQPSLRVTKGVPELWIALTGGASWGGCRIWMSIDGTRYEQIGTQYGPARAGSLTAPLGVYADPDTTNTLSVSVSGTLATVSMALADAFATLCLVGGELIAYETATLTGSGIGTENYSLTYLRRGVFSSGIAAHAAGEQFVRLDGQVFQYAFDPSLLGKTVQLKFTSRNLYGQAEEDISTVTARPFTFGAAGNSSTMAVVSLIDPSDATHAILHIFHAGGAYTDAGTATLPNGATIAVPAATYTGEALGTFYAVNYNPVTSAYVVYTDANAWLADQHADMIAIGTTTTPGSGSAGIYYPSSASDLGSFPTATPSGAWSGSSPAVVSSQATYTASTDDSSSADGILLVDGFAGVTTVSTSLYATAVVDIQTTAHASSIAVLSYTLDGYTWTNFLSTTATLAPAGYSVAVPVGTNLAHVAVQASCHSTALPASFDTSSHVTLTLLAIRIA